MMYLISLKNSLIYIYSHLVCSNNNSDFGKVHGCPSRVIIMTGRKGGKGTYATTFGPRSSSSSRRRGEPKPHLQIIELKGFDDTYVIEESNYYLQLGLT
jgi:hypothetical protein